MKRAHPTGGGFVRRHSLMKKISVRKVSLRDPGGDDLKGKSPEELLGMMWQLALDAWSFKENLSAEPRLQRHVVVLKRRGG
jgi:hypothetical protein